MIRTYDLCKSFGQLHAIQDLSLTVNRGDIYGFIGPNGAGKSTTFKILATLLRPDSGEALINKIRVRFDDLVRPIIGYMPDTFGVYHDMTVAQYLDFFAAAYYIPRKQRKKLINDILYLTDLLFKKDAMVQTLSRGMKQRLGIARVLVHDPKVLILDEPASGLDPRARIELRELLKELQGMGKTILISSHILSELAEICNRVGILEAGTLVFEGPQERLRETLRDYTVIKLETVEPAGQTYKLLQKVPMIKEIQIEQNLLHIKLQPGCYHKLHLIPNFLFKRHLHLRRFELDEPDLETAFMVLTKGRLA